MLMQPILADVPPGRSSISPLFVGKCGLIVCALAMGVSNRARSEDGTINRLPPVGAPSAAPTEGVLPRAAVAPPDLVAATPVQYDASFDSAFSPPQEPSSVAAVVPLHRSRTSDAKAGVLQRAALEGAWLAPSGSDDVGLTEVTTGVTLGAPLAGGAVLVSPGYALSLFDGPDMTDIPADLHALSLNVKYYRQFAEGIGGAVWVVPGLYSDFEQDHADAFRLGGGAVATLQRTGTTKWIVGVVYLGRKDISILPAVGLVWTPSDVVRFDLVFPRPEAKWMMFDCAGVEWWGFVAGELGGNTWAYQTWDGSSDELSYRDYRVTVGVERRGPADVKSRFEVGYVFGRELELAGPSTMLDFDDTIMLRGGIVY